MMDRQFCYFQPAEIEKMLVGFPNPTITDRNAPISLKKAREYIIYYRLFQKNRCATGWLLPTGHLLPCSHQGHIMLAFAMNFRHSYGEITKDTYINCDTVAERAGWIKISDYAAHVLWRPNIKQKRALRSIADYTANVAQLQYATEEDEWNSLEPPPTGFVIPKGFDPHAHSKDVWKR